MDGICWGKATKAKKPSNEHDPYALAVLKNVRGGAAGGYGCATRLCTVKPRPPFVEVASTLEGVGIEGYTSAGAGTQQRLNRKVLYESTQQWHDQLYASP